jgi:diguanylate cyclase (GGDEF)-like protein
VRLRLEQSRSWLLRFGALSLLAILATCLLLARTFEGSIRERKIDDARREVAAPWQAVESRLGRKLSAGGRLGGRERRLLDRTLGTLVRNREVGYVRVRNARAKPIWSRGTGGRGRSAPGGKALEQALGGRPAGEIVTANVNGPASEELRSYFPLRAGPGAAAAGVLEAGEAFRPIETAAASDARALYLPLLGCGALLFAALLGIAVGTSTRLRRQVASSDEQARRDLLTGLPNRTTFHELVERATAGARREKRQMAIMLMDLDRFKEVNDTLGHAAGDSVLRDFASRLQAAVRKGDTMARLGGDEFAVIVTARQPDDVLALVRRIQAAVELPFSVHGLPIGLEVSIGIAQYPEHGEDPETLTRHADIAMYSAKVGRTGYAVYDAATSPMDTGKLTIVTELRRAIENDELVLHYQPKADLASGEVTSVEALVRWEHPERGLIPPDDFIPVAQQTTLVKPLTTWVLNEALRQCRAWEDEGLTLSVAINLSPRNLSDPELPTDLASLLKKWRLAPSRVELEITETAIVSDPFRAKAVLDRLGAMGVRLSIDDFGTGYSSLEYLKRLPVNEIKIDRSFVTRMLESEDDGIIVRSTIDLARNLGLDVVAEGVEDEETWSKLKALNCDTAQGYLLSRPLPAEELTSRLRELHGGADSASAADVDVA